MPVYYQMQMDRLSFIRLSQRKLGEPQSGSIDAEGMALIEPTGPLFVVCDDENIFPAVDLGGTGFQLTADPSKYSENPIKVALDGEWVEI